MQYLDEASIPMQDSTNYNGPEAWQTCKTYRIV